MRNALLKVAILTCAILTLSGVSTHALTLNDLSLTEDPFSKKAALLNAKEQEAVLIEKNESEKNEAQAPTEPEPKPPITHTVVTGETLTAIAEKYETTWKRLFDKNTQISNPDALNIDEVITIPEADEELAERPVPSATPMSTGGAMSTSSTVLITRGSTAGNTYAPGYCTWYAKNRRPDLPNRMGNASSWVASAAAQGFATGSAPRAGAIGQQGNHVVYVESVNGDGTVTVSEMNYRGLFVVSSRTVAASTFTYIY